MLNNQTMREESLEFLELLGCFLLAVLIKLLFEIFVSALRFTFIFMSLLQYLSWNIFFLPNKKKLSHDSVWFWRNKRNLWQKRVSSAHWEFSYDHQRKTARQCDTVDSTIFTSFFVLQSASKTRADAMLQRTLCTHIQRYYICTDWEKKVTWPIPSGGLQWTDLRVWCGAHYIILAAESEWTQKDQTYTTELRFVCVNSQDKQ